MLSLQILRVWLQKPSVQKAIMRIVALGIIGAVSWGGYGYWKNALDTRAQQALAELNDRYESALSVGSEDSLQEIAPDAQKAYKEYSSSSLAPYFLICESQCYVLLEEYEKARLSLEKACGLFQKQKKSPLSAYYRISLANMLLDQGNEEMHERALSILRECEQDKKNPFHEMALYFHGLYLLNHVSLAQAEQAWAPFFHDPFYQDSYWREKALESKELL